jgi:hypothetical protein
MKLPTIKRKLPEVFTDENNYFGKNQSWIDTWQSCKTCALYCAILAISAIYLQWWWALPILTFVGLMAISYAGTIETKAGSGYPYLEPGDVMGVMFGGLVVFFFCASAFLAIVFSA